MSKHTTAFRRPPRPTLWVLAGLICALAPAHAARVQSERTWTHPEIDRFVLPRIAVLPAVAAEGGLDVCPFVEKRWMSATRGPRMRWVPAVVTRPLLQQSVNEAMSKRLARDVLRSGRVDSTTAPGIARVLGVRGLLCLRIDYWRRESAKVQGGSRMVVGLTGTLVDSTGTLLWSGVGRGEHETASVSNFTEEFGQAPAEFDSAITVLVGSWAASVSATHAAAAARAP